MNPTKWMQSRIGVANKVTTHARSVFILPTRQGLFFVVTLLAMTIGCINYNLNLGYGLTFLVFSIALGGMHRTHQNLMNLSLSVSAGEPVFAGKDSLLSVNISVSSAQKTPKYAFEFEIKNLEVKNISSAVIAELQANTATSTLLKLPATRRGAVPCPRIIVSTTYPIGLWRAWSYVYPDLVQYVYAAPMPPSPAVALLNDANDSPHIAPQIIAPQFKPHNPNAAQDTLSHIEPATNDTPMRRIHWPSMARGIEAAKILHADETPSDQVILDFAKAWGDTETRLSHLSYGVETAYIAGVAFALKLPNLSVPAAHCWEHRAACQLALAQFDAGAV